MTKLDQAKKAGVKIAAGYGIYRKVKGWTVLTANQRMHEWRVDGDYQAGLFSAAQTFAEAHQIANPFVKQAGFEHERNADAGWQSTDWTTLRVPGVKTFIQAKTMHGDELHFRAFTKADLETVRNRVLALQQEEDDEIEYDDEYIQPTTNIMSWDSKKNEWEYRTGRPSRSFSSVFLPAELQHRIEEDLRSFTTSKERLTRLELPWRRGYLLTGPPGTGKTSLSLTIAGALKFSVATLSLTEIESDETLRRAVSMLRPRTVLVIEDIDAYSVTNDREHNAARDGKLSLSGILNALDGFETPNGLITIATTNHVGHLDAALIRPGRLDREFDLNYIEPAELERLFTWFYDGVPDANVTPRKAPANTGAASIAPAQVAEVFKQHLNDPVGGWEAILSVIQESTQSLRLVTA